MPETPVYGFAFESPQSKPGISVTGDIDGTSPILAEQVETEIASLDSRVTANEGDIAILQSGAANDTGWLALSIAPASGFNVNDAIYRHWGPVVSIFIQLLRTGADISANSSGNVIGDPALCTINTVAARPDRNLSVIGRCSITSGSVDIDTTGAAEIVDLHSDSALRTDDRVSISAMYFVNTFS